MTATRQSGAGESAGAERLAGLGGQYRAEARLVLGPLVEAYYPALALATGPEYRKMLELSAKMALVGHACTEIAGENFDIGRRRLAILFGGCCFLADSFLDDFGEEAARNYLARFERLLATGWFEITNPRERLFYVIIALMAMERDILAPLLRQAILALHAAQAEDVMLRLEPWRMAGFARRGQLRLLRRSARNRSGHAILVLAIFLVQNVALSYLAGLFSAGSLIMFIDDHGDCHTDLRAGRITYMNRLCDPERVLRKIFSVHCRRIEASLAGGPGRRLLLGFLGRYYRSRLAKHRAQRAGGGAWDVYE